MSEFLFRAAMRIGAGSIVAIGSMPLLMLIVCGLGYPETGKAIGLAFFRIIFVLH